MCRAPIPASFKRQHDTLPTGPSMHLSADGWGQAEGNRVRRGAKKKMGLPFPSVFCVFLMV